FICCAMAGLFRSRAALQAEILVLRHQLNILRRRSPTRVVLGKRPLSAGIALGFRAYGRWRSRRRGGRPRISSDIRHLIVEMSVANPLWGAPRIHGELLKLGATSARPRLQNTWPGEGGHCRKAGRPSFAIMPAVSHRSTCLPFPSEGRNKNEVWSC